MSAHLPNGPQSTTLTENLSAAAPEMESSPDSFTTTAPRSQLSFFTTYTLYCPLMLISWPFVVFVPLAVGAYLVLRYDQVARGKLLERVRSVFFLMFLMTVFTITLAMSWPALTFAFGLVIAIGATLVGLILPPLFFIGGLYFLVTAFA